MLTHLDTFSGIGGFALAAQRLGGIKTRQFVEIDPFCRQILSRHFPDIPCHDDIQTFNPSMQFDLITAGFPCQDISHANSKRKGLAGERSGLFFEIIRLVRSIRPRYIILENSAALLNSNSGRDMGTILWELAECGYSAEWSVLSACSLGAPHTRERLFIVAYSDRFNGQKRMALYPPNPKQLQEDHQGSLSGNWERTTPRITGVVNGVPHRLDRVRALGNAVVPEVAAIALSRVLEVWRCENN